MRDFNGEITISNRFVAMFISTNNDVNHLSVENRSLFPNLNALSYFYDVNHFSVENWPLFNCSQNSSISMLKIVCRNSVSLLIIYDGSSSQVSEIFYNVFR